MGTLCLENDKLLIFSLDISRAVDRSVRRGPKDLFAFQLRQELEKSGGRISRSGSKIKLWPGEPKIATV